MRNFTNEMKKNVLRIAAGAMTAISLAAAPLTVSAATPTNKAEATIAKQVREPILSRRNIPILLSEDMINNDSAVTAASVQGYRFPRLFTNADTSQACTVSYYTLDDYDFPAIYPGEYITNDFDEPVNLVFFDSDVDYYVMVTIPAGGDYLVQYQESASGITVETYDYWDCYDIDGNYYFFLPNTGF